MRLRALLFAVVASLTCAGAAQAAWYSGSWAKRTQLTLNGALVPAAQTNFPVLVAWTADAALAAGAQASGNDILFTAADGTTKLDHEIESYTSATGALAAWVRIPALASGSNTTIYMYYGNAGAANQQNKVGVWDANFKGVWHLVETPANGVAGTFDSTSSGFTGTPQGFADGTPGSTNATGIVAGADNYLTDTYNVPPGNTVNRTEVPDNAALRPNGDLTVEAWANFANPTSGQFLVYKWALANFAYQLLVGNSGGPVAAFQRYNTGATGPLVAGTTVLQPNTWYHIVGVVSGGNVQIYVNGNLEGTLGGVTGNIYSANPQALVIGATFWGAGGLNGREDEVRFSDTARSGSWLRTEYNNLTNQGVGAGKFILGATAETVPIASVYYSVGTSPADLKAGAPTITISAGTATFSIAQPNNVGVGDEITYNGATRAYISGRTSATQYSVTTATGTTPPDVNDLTVNQIRRAFNSLSAAEVGSSNAAHLNTTDLLGGLIQLNWPCYSDGPIVMAAGAEVVISGYTTGPANYIRAYTPVTSNEVGVSQRHSGVFGTGFRLEGTNADTIQIEDDYVRIEGLTIQATVTAAGAWGGIWSIPGAASDIRISHNIVKGVVTAGNPAYGIAVGTSAADVNKVWNNVVFNLTNTGGAAYGIGISIDNGFAYVFNNTIFNCETGIRKYPSAIGAEVRNNAAIHNTVANPGYVDYDQLGAAPAAVRSNNVSSDASSETVALQSKTAFASYFRNTGAGTEDLHLRASSLSLWTANGTDLSAHANLPVTNDIDGGPRVRPDIGADEFSATQAYYSVGTAAGALYSANASATSGVVTLASAAANNIGVGDEVRVGATAPRYYITGRVSSTVFTIQDSAAGGGIPGATNITFASTAITIRRAFNLLSTAEASSSDANRLNTANLVAANFQLNWPCYNDAPMADQVAISGYTTGPGTYIRVYTPVLASEVGASQRHNGLARTGFRLQPTSAVDNDSIRVFDAFVRVEGIEIDGSLSAATNGAGGVDIESGATAPAEHHVSHNIIYDTRNFTGIYVNAMTAKVWNNVLHNVDNTTFGALAMNQAAGTAWFYNNTVYDHAGSGIVRVSGTLTARNNVSMNKGSGSDFSGAMTQSNNASGDGTAVGAINMTAYANYFKSTTAGSEDLHLKGTSLALWGSNGMNLSGDANLPVTNDIDLGARVRPDIGADEFTATQLFRSVGPLVTPLATGGGNALTISGSTATFAVALPNNVGVGDAIPYDASGDGSIDSIAFIHGRTSAQSYTVKNAQGGTPTAVAGDNDWRLFRAYTTLANWESQSEHAFIDIAVRNFDNASTDLVLAGAVMNVACYGDAPDTVAVTINGWTTGPETYINIFTPVLPGHVGTTQRHTGTWASGGYALVADAAFFGVLYIQDDYVRVTGLRIENTHAEPAGGTDQVLGIQSRPAAPFEVRLSQNIIRATGSVALSAHDWRDSGLYQFSDGGVLKAWNNLIYGFGSGIASEYINTTGTYALYNNTVANYSDVGIYFQGAATGVYRWANNLVQGTGGAGNYYTADLQVPGLDYSSTNLSQDASAPAAVGGGGAPVNGVVAFVGAPDYHLSVADTNAKDQGTNLSADPWLAVYDDIDGQVRATPWDIGADDADGTTEVELLSFTATGTHGAVDLAWTTASELDNLGFHLHRALAPGGPWERITPSLIPGLGSSPTGATYRHRDSGLANGTTYYYLLEDVETSGRTTQHGPIAAVPGSDTSGGSEGSGGGTGDGTGEGGDGEAAGKTYGDAGLPSLSILERGPAHVVLELLTPGFVAMDDQDGSVRLEVSGFELPQSPGSPAVPVRNALVDALAARRARVTSVRAEDVLTFPGLRVALEGAPELVVSDEGVVRPGLAPRRAALESARGAYYPRTYARLLGTAFQGEIKKARLELAPLRYDAASRQVVLTRRLLVRVDFAGLETGERSLGGARGRRPPAGLARTKGVLAQFVTGQAGLYRVSFESVFPGRTRGVLARTLRLSRRGTEVPFHVEPARALFAPGSFLYFAGGGDQNPTGDTVYELELGRTGSQMSLVSASPSGPDATTHEATRVFEENHLYQAALLDAPDLWLWELLVSPATKSHAITLTNVDPGGMGRLKLWLQGASDFEADPDHHLRVSLNGSFIAEASWDGKREQVIEADLAPGVLQEGANTLSLENVGDTPAAYSMVFLNRFEVTQPRLGVAEGGRLEGRFIQSGTAALAGLGADAVVLDTTTVPQWLSGATADAGIVRFRVEAGRRYLVTDPAAVLTPEVRPAVSHLRRTSNRADWLLLAPREFLPAASPLAELRQEQGLVVKTVALEDVYQEFGFGERGPEAIRAFLGYAWQSWRKPSPRYVVLLGDSTYDPKDYLGTHVADRLPFHPVKTTYMWTASDPAFAAVNGDDLVPDLAIGRLSAASLAEAQVLVAKLVAFERAGRDLDGKAVLVADNADVAGAFEADSDDLAATVLQGREVQKIYLRDLGPGGTRAEVRGAFDSGASLLSYVGHGATAVWASENVFNNQDVADLAAQADQPLLMTMNCLNGFFHFPPLNSLAEALVKADGKGAIAAFSPSGLSLNDAAHLYHKALLAEIASGAHARLGDAVLAAQADYADSGAFPELLSIYHLFGDPAMKIRP